MTEACSPTHITAQSPELIVTGYWLLAGYFQIKCMGCLLVVTMTRVDVIQKQIVRWPAQISHD